MAHKMVRQPSETPNINNIDDIVPFRYAYGNQDGYVIGKGNELSYTINGNEFRINSGRVVLQGVEDDIDANGVTFIIDDIASKRYFVIYYRVNLATNTTSYEIISDGAGYPTIDVGDDLTKNSSGIANLPLYRFTASSGVISGVEKVVKAIEYIKNITVENAKKVNNLEIEKDENGVLRVGDIIIPQKKVLWSSEEGLVITPDNSFTTRVELEGIKKGDTLELVAASDSYEAVVTRVKILHHSFTAQVCSKPTYLASANANDDLRPSHITCQITFNTSSDYALLGCAKYPTKIESSTIQYQYVNAKWYSISKIIE